MRAIDKAALTIFKAHEKHAEKMVKMLDAKGS